MITNDMDAILTIEQKEDATQDELIEAYQHLIDTGTVWQLQGSYGRAAARLIAMGYCHGSPRVPYPYSGSPA